MKIRLKSSGGFANIELAGELDSADLPPELAELVERRLTPEGLEAATTVATESVNPYAADSMQYELTIEGGDDGEPRTFVLDDAAADPELVDTLALLMREIVRRRRGDGGGAEEE